LDDRGAEYDGKHHGRFDFHSYEISLSYCVVVHTGAAYVLVRGAARGFPG
jgi:hypothetical protein